jgi:hypothetical protein
MEERYTNESDFWLEDEYKEWLYLLVNVWNKSFTTKYGINDAEV